MDLDYQNLALLPLFTGIQEEDFPAMLACLGSFQKKYKKMKLFFLKVAKSEMLVSFYQEQYT